MYLDEALKAVREDENIEMSWGCKARWYAHKEYDESMPLKDLLEKTFSVRRRKPPVMELTVADIEERYGCKVKIVK